MDDIFGSEDMANRVVDNHSKFYREKKAATLDRFKQFLSREPGAGDARQSAAIALRSLSAENIKPAIRYLDTAIEETKAKHAATSDESVRAELEVRLNDLERWQRSFV